jgi:serine phosphatase RsbU (regulator of sigma subunit)/TPR repeat protein
MKRIINILFVLISFQGISQTYGPDDQKFIDEIREIINNPKTHDTLLANSYLNLGERLYIYNLDTLKSLSIVARDIAEDGLAKNPSATVKATFKNILASAFNNIGYVNKKYGELTESLKNYKKSLSIQIEINNKAGVADTYFNMGALYLSTGKIINASKYFQKSLMYFIDIDDHYGVADCYNELGLIHNNNGNITLALEYYLKSMKLYQKIGEQRGLSLSYNNIAYIYEHQNDTAYALEFYHKSLKIREELGDKSGIAMSLINISNIYSTQKRYQVALDYQHRALDLFQSVGDKNGVANAYSNLGATYKKNGDEKLVLICINKSLKLREEIEDKQGIVNSLCKLGKIQLINKEYPKAKQSGKKALKLANELGFTNQIERASELLYLVAQKQGDWRTALEMYKLQVKMIDSINNKETQKATIRQQTKYEFEKVQAVKDKEHEKQLEVEKEAKVKQQVITYATAGGLGLTGIFLFFVINRLKVTRKQKAVIEQQKEVVEEAHQEIQDSIAYAKRIQSAILPPAKLVKEYLKDNFILYKPKDVVAGDFYWMEHKDGKVLFAAADCTGHGVPGAMVSVVCNNALNRSVREHGLTDPGEILTKTREIVIQEFEKSEEEVKDGMDIALCSLVGNKLKYAGAHNPLWIIRKGEIIETKANKQPIGQFDNPVPYTTHSFDLEAGDSLYIFSDGYVDQFGGKKGKKYKARAFRELLLSNQDKTMEEQKTIIDDSFETWKGDLEQIDDVCVIGVRI